MRVSSELSEALELASTSATSTTSTLREVTRAILRAILRVQQDSWEHQPLPGDQGFIKDDRLAPLLGSSSVHVLWALDVLFARKHLWLEC